jgi:hypothetical protein
MGATAGAGVFAGGDGVRGIDTRVAEAVHPNSKPPGDSVIYSRCKGNIVAVQTREIEWRTGQAYVGWVAASFSIAVSQLSFQSIK